MGTFLAHWAFEMGGSGCWACCRGRCSTRWHRYVGDGVLTALLTGVLLAYAG